MIWKNQHWKNQYHLKKLALVSEINDHNMSSGREAWYDVHKFRQGLSQND